MIKREDMILRWKSEGNLIFKVNDMKFLKNPLNVLLRTVKRVSEL